MQIIDCEQNSPAWKAARMGIPTASMFAAVCQLPGPRGGSASARDTYLYKLAGEQLTGLQMANVNTATTRRGHDREQIAVDRYEFITGNQCEKVGFIRNDDLVRIGGVGASPDRLIDSDGLLEAKTREAHLQIELLLTDQLPPEHIYQIQGQLWVAERDWCDFICESPRLELFTKRVYRNDRMAAEIKVAVDQFNQDLEDVIYTIRRRIDDE